MPQPLRPFTSKLVPLLADNVDTDQIIPARYLKGTSKDGLGEGLFADIFRNNALKNGLLPVELPADAHAELAAAVEADPEAEVTVDLSSETVTLPGGRAVGFGVDPFARQMLLDGTDELGYLLSQGAAVAAYEDAHPARVDTTAPAWGG